MNTIDRIAELDRQIDAATSDYHKTLLVRQLLGILDQLADSGETWAAGYADEIRHQHNVERRDARPINAAELDADPQAMPKRRVDAWPQTDQGDDLELPDASPPDQAITLLTFTRDLPDDATAAMQPLLDTVNEILAAGTVRGFDPDNPKKCGALYALYASAVVTLSGAHFDRVQRPESIDRDAWLHALDQADDRDSTAALRWYNRLRQRAGLKTAGARQYKRDLARGRGAIQNWKH